MRDSLIYNQLCKNLGNPPTDDQSTALKKLAVYIAEGSNDVIFLMTGYAGTGKTSLIAAVVNTWDKLQKKCILLAPTGRAAKVLSHYSSHNAFTIHKKIYRQKSFSNEIENFSLNDNLYSDTLFIVDEASMISNEGLSGSVFGTGRLLDDLIEFVYSGKNCRLLLIGDTAQLPPIGEFESPALSAEMIKGYGIEVFESILTQVVRQLDESGILYNATQLRNKISNEEFDFLPKLSLNKFPDIMSINGNDLIEKINECYDKTSIEDTMIICRSNKRANIYNKGIRNSILYREDELNSGDLLMIAKNNYFWTANSKEIDFIANGDIGVVKRVRKTREMYGFRFADIVLSLPDYNDIEIEVKVILDTLHSDGASLPKEQNDKLFYTILEDYKDISLKRERMKKMKEDVHYNALQVKYAYAITGHKAQGGQWKKVFIDQGYMTDEMLTPDYYKWLYTAITRATETLYLVNWPKSQME